MSKRAEEKAREKYPYETGMKGLICENSRGIYIQGYEQAEKDIKDALLEWAKETYLNENASAIRKVCFKQLVDKLMSM